jgi:hypothetical protein
VKTQYGYHIIKLTDKKRPRRSRSTRSARRSRSVKWERAQPRRSASPTTSPRAETAGGLRHRRQGRGLTVGESALFSKDEPIAGLGVAPAVAERAFELKDGEVSEAIRTPQGFAFVTVTGRQDAVRAEARRSESARARRSLKKKAIDVARQKAATLAPK